MGHARVDWCDDSVLVFFVGDKVGQNDTQQQTND